MLFFQLLAKHIPLEEAVLFLSKESLVRIVKERPEFSKKIYTALDPIAYKKGFTSTDVQRIVDQKLKNAPHQRTTKEQATHNSIATTMSILSIGLHDTPSPTQKKTFFNQKIKPLLTIRNYQEIIKHVRETLLAHRPIDSADQLFLIFYGMAHDDWNKTWYFDPSSGDIIIDVWGDGNCFWHALLKQRPSLLRQAGFTSMQIIEFITTPASRGYMHFNNKFIYPFKTAVAAMIRNLDLNQDLGFYENRGQSFIPEDGRLNNVRTMFVRFAKTISPEYTHTAEFLTDTQLKELMIRHILHKDNYTDIIVSKLIAFLFHLNIHLFSVSESAAAHEFLSQYPERENFIDIGLLFTGNHFKMIVSPTALLGLN